MFSPPPTPRPILPTVTLDEYSVFVYNYFTEKIYPHQRFGQAFMNFCLTPLTHKDLELFNEKDTKTAIRIIRSKYIDM